MLIGNHMKKKHSKMFETKAKCEQISDKIQLKVLL